MLYIVLLCVPFLQIADSLDPCITDKVLDDLTRTASYTLGDSEKEGCDHDLSPNWYKIKDDGNIPTKCPSLLRCGSTLPVWINGTLPTKKDTQMSLQACQRGLRTTDCCQKQYTVEVKNCGKFNVYKLNPLDSCPGRYCIEGPPTPCQNGYSSESGFEPCYKIGIRFSVSPTVKPFIPTFDPNEENRGLAFECYAPMPYSYQRYLFDIKWYIDKSEVAMKKLVTYDLLKRNGSLYVNDNSWATNKKMGFLVRCDIRARLNSASVPSGFNSSKEFYAGAKIEQTSYSVKAGSQVTIKVMSTVPIACVQIRSRMDCKFRMELFSLENQFTKKGPKYCNQSLTQQIQGSKCGINFNGINWNQWHYLTVTAKVDPTTRSEYTASVKLRAISTIDSFWDNYHLPEVKIRIQSQTIPSALCRSYNDPHIETFDHKGYNTYETGEFILVNHTSKPIQIHVIHRVSTGFQQETCAIAIKAASDIFMIYGCNEPTKWIIRRLNCDRIRQTLEVFDRGNGKEYEIVLPTGTRVNVIVNYKWLNINIYPSAIDYKQTEGLCGTYNENQSDDFTSRHGGIVQQSEFVKSWSVPQSESLFISRSRNEILRTQVLYCSCIADLDARGPLTEKADCSWKDSLPLCQGLNWNQNLCNINRKRSTHTSVDDEDDIDVPVDIVSFRKAPNEMFRWKNGWTEQLARERCWKVLKQSSMYNACHSLPTVNNTLTVESCVADIQVTGSDTYLNASADALKSQCVNEIRTNASLWSSNNVTTGSLLSEDLIEQDCLNDCSSIGQCIKGFCHCPPGFTSDDCSARLDRAPEVFNNTDDAFCDMRRRTCNAVSLFGKGFYKSSSIQCRIIIAKINGSAIIKQGNQSTMVVNGRMVTFSEISCPVAQLSGRRKRSTLDPSSADAYLISISMNGKDFSKSVPVVMYNSSCTDCSFKNGAILCHPRDDVCIKDGACFKLADDVCGGNNELRMKKSNEIEQNNLWIIGAGLGGVCLCIIITVIGVKMCTSKRRLVMSELSSKQNLKE